jgi:hypothetical protein
MRSSARRRVGLGRSHDAEKIKLQTFPSPESSLCASPLSPLHTLMPMKVRKRGLFVIECIPYALLPVHSNSFLLLKFNVRCIEISFLNCLHFVYQTINTYVNYCIYISQQ